MEEVGVGVLPKTFMTPKSVCVSSFDAGPRSALRAGLLGCGLRLPWLTDFLSVANDLEITFVPGKGALATFQSRCDFLYRDVALRYPIEHGEIGGRLLRNIVGFKGMLCDDNGKD